MIYVPNLIYKFRTSRVDSGSCLIVAWHQVGSTHSTYLLDMAVFSFHPFVSGFLPLLCLLGLISAARAAQMHVHDEAFTPAAVLRVSAQNISTGGIYRYSTLVNGTVPGPELRLPEGQVVWVRVYNDMTDQNTTIVSPIPDHITLYGLGSNQVLPLHSTGTASRRPRLPSPTGRRSRPSGRSRRSTSSTTSSSSLTARPGPTFITAT